MRLQIGFARMLLQMPLIKKAEQLEVLLLQFAAKTLRRVEVEDARFLGTQHRALKQGRHPTARPIVRAIDGVTAGIRKDHVGG